MIFKTQLYKLGNIRGFCDLAVNHKVFPTKVICVQNKFVTFQLFLFITNVTILKASHELQNY